MNETSFEELGLKLKTQREAKGLSLRDIADRTRIPLSNLEALEAGDPRGLPASVFVKGFLRSYALEIGLKPDDIIHEYKTINLQQEEHQIVEKKVRGDGPSLASLRKMVAPGIALVALLLIVFYIYPWLTGPDQDQPGPDPVVAVNEPDQPQPPADAQPAGTDSADQPETQVNADNTPDQPAPGFPAVDQPVTPDAADTPASGPQEQPETNTSVFSGVSQPDTAVTEPQDQPEPADPPSITEETVAANSTGPADAPAEPDNSVTAAPAEPDNSVTAAPAVPLTSINTQNYTPPVVDVPEEPRTASLDNGPPPTVDAPPVAMPGPTEPPAHGHELKVVFEDETWIQVMIDGSQEAQHGFYQAGTSRTWKADDGFSVRIGNAGGVKIIFDGRDLGSPGQAGAVVKINLPEKD